jgi:hypothetical protein
MVDFGSEWVKMDLQELGCAGMEWNGLAQNRDTSKALVNLQVP